MIIKRFWRFVRAGFIPPSCLILVLGCLLLTACDNNPAPATATPMAVVTAGPTATMLAMMPTIAPALTSTIAPTITSSLSPIATPCPAIAPPPTLTAAPTPSDYVPGTPQATLPRATLHILTACRSVTLNVQIASTAAQQEQGLMGRTDMAQDEGMLFDFGRPDSADTFWMKNTPNPLSIAFISGDLYVVTLDEMAAFDDKTFHASTAPYQYAVEANAGFFTRYGVQVGDKVEIVKQ